MNLPAQLPINASGFLAMLPMTFWPICMPGATATFFPSRYEGFGLPILESMACGTPVVTCNNSSLAEVGGEAAIYVDPGDVDGITSLMRQFEVREIPGAIPKKQEMIIQSSRFSWESCAASYLAFYLMSLR